MNKLITLTRDGQTIKVLELQMAHDVQLSAGKKFKHGGGKMWTVTAVEDAPEYNPTQVPPTEHTQDYHCTVNAETLLCDVCGVDHSDECADCAGRGFHAAVCPSQAQTESVPTRLYVPVNGEPTTEAEKIEAISHDFAMRLSVEIGDDNLREVVRLNATPEYAGCCASHDFCDANVTMLDSMRAWGYEVFTTEGNIDDDQMRVMNAAWDQAKLYNFDI